MKYEVEIYRHIQESCIVTVEADNEIEAQNVARETANSLSRSEWRRDYVVDMSTFNCIEVQKENS